MKLKCVLKVLFLQSLQLTTCASHLGTHPFQLHGPNMEWVCGIHILIHIVTICYESPLGRKFQNLNLHPSAPLPQIGNSIMSVLSTPNTVINLLKRCFCCLFNFLHHTMVPKDLQNADSLLKISTFLMYSGQKNCSNVC